MSEVSKYRGLDPAAGGMTMKIKAVSRRVDELVALTGSMNDEQLKLLGAIGTALGTARRDAIEARLEGVFFARLEDALAGKWEAISTDQEADAFLALQIDTTARVLLGMEDRGLYPSDGLLRRVESALGIEDMSGAFTHEVWERMTVVDNALQIERAALRSATRASANGDQS